MSASLFEFSAILFFGLHLKYFAFFDGFVPLQPYLKLCKVTQLTFAPFEGLPTYYFVLDVLRCSAVVLRLSCIHGVGPYPILRQFGFEKLNYFLVLDCRAN